MLMKMYIKFVVKVTYLPEIVLKQKKKYKNDVFLWVLHNHAKDIK